MLDNGAGMCWQVNFGTARVSCVVSKGDVVTVCGVFRSLRSVLRVPSCGATMTSCSPYQRSLIHRGVTSGLGTGRGEDGPGRSSGRLKLRGCSRCLARALPAWILRGSVRRGGFYIWASDDTATYVLFACLCTIVGGISEHLGG